MASINHMADGTRRITFKDAAGKYRTIYCGRMSKADAAFLKLRVEALVSVQGLGNPPTGELAAWLATVGDDVYGKLVNVGLVEPREAVAMPTVDAFINAYLADRVDVKASTLTAMHQSRIWLVRYLGEARKLDDVTTADADGYKAHMIREKKSKAHINKRIRYARHFFAIALRRKLVQDNPFGHLRGAVVGNPARREFVPANVIEQVIEHVPCVQWKLLIALARFGGLRIPSEALALKWGDVDFNGKRFIVRSSKTEHHEDGGIRIVPMFPELVDRFQAVYDAAAEGDEHVITRYRDAGTNLRQQFGRWIAAAGVKPWPKLWQNLRASRATELADMYPSHVCAGWLGHTEKIADSFYRMTTDAHFDRAVTVTATEAMRQTMRVIAEQGVTEANGDGVSVTANAAEHPGNTAFTDDSGKGVALEQVGGTGLEPVTSTL